ncbi:unnamed protein product, partial [marine sediment metagenome]
AYSEIAEREAKSFEVRDFRQVLGWRIWLFILANYKYMVSPADHGESANQFEDYLDSHSKMLKSIATAILDLSSPSSAVTTSDLLSIHLSKMSNRKV